ncbi:MAG: hypothetical protein Q7S27_07145 [Nanoarchaeota archaeon]|nr:hypothetical protein [Nanoarchaeota archaeon]
MSLTELSEAYEIGRIQPVYFDGRAISLNVLKNRIAADLLDKEVILMGYPLEVRLIAFDSFGRDYFDKNSFIYFLDRKIIPIYENLYDINILLKINLAKSSMIGYSDSPWEDSAYYVLEEYTSSIFSPIYDDC